VRKKPIAYLAGTTAAAKKYTAKQIVA